MARAKTKLELIQNSDNSYNELLTLIKSIPNDKIDNDFTFDISKRKEAHWKRDRNVKDILIHLYEWHELLINWINKNQNGEKANFLPSPYNWKTYGDMNIKFWEKHQDTSFEDALKMFNKSHSEVMDIINKFTDEELFTKAYFDWTGTTTLGSYCVSATSSHYEWAIKKIKLHIKSLY